jgi:hypothetical protein
MSHNPDHRSTSNHSHDLHVMPDVVGWKIISANHPKPLAITRTRDEAIALAMRMEYEDPDSGDVLVHAIDGSIRERRRVTRADLFPQREGA